MPLPTLTSTLAWTRGRLQPHPRKSACRWLNVNILRPPYVRVVPLPVGHIEYTTPALIMSMEWERVFYAGPADMCIPMRPQSTFPTSGLSVHRHMHLIH